MGRYSKDSEPIPGYKLSDFLGRGGFGEVWKALGPGGIRCAIKIIDLAGDQGAQEFKSLRVVKEIPPNPHLVLVNAFWLKDDNGAVLPDEAFDFQSTPSSAVAATMQYTRPVELIISMPLGDKCLFKRLLEIKNEVARENVEFAQGIPPEELLDYMEDAAKGIDHLNHRCEPKIIHGDIKPHNILVVGGSAAICDFGLAKAVQKMRKTSMSPMTLAYAAPESFEGHLNEYSDQYCLAVTYYELRTGVLPFPEDTPVMQVIKCHTEGRLDLSQLPPAERSVIARATSVDPTKRWRRCREMVEELKRAHGRESNLVWVNPGPRRYLETRPSQPETPNRGLDETSRHLAESGYLYDGPKSVNPPEPPIRQTIVQHPRRGSKLLAGFLTLLLAAAGAGWWFWSDSESIDFGGLRDLLIRVDGLVAQERLLESTSFVEALKLLRDPRLPPETDPEMLEMRTDRLEKKRVEILAEWRRHLADGVAQIERNTATEPARAFAELRAIGQLLEDPELSAEQRPIVETAFNNLLNARLQALQGSEQMTELGVTLRQFSDLAQDPRLVFASLPNVQSSLLAAQSRIEQGLTLRAEGEINQLLGQLKFPQAAEAIKTLSSQLSGKATTPAQQAEQQRILGELRDRVGRAWAQDLDRRVKAIGGGTPNLRDRVREMRNEIGQAELNLGFDVMKTLLVDTKRRLVDLDIYIPPKDQIEELERQLADRQFLTAIEGALKLQSAAGLSEAQKKQLTQLVATARQGMLDEALALFRGANSKEGTDRFVAYEDTKTRCDSLARLFPNDSGAQLLKTRTVEAAVLNPEVEVPPLLAALRNTSALDLAQQRVLQSLQLIQQLRAELVALNDAKSMGDDVQRMKRIDTARQSIETWRKAAPSTAASPWQVADLELARIDDLAGRLDKLRSSIAQSALKQQIEALVKSPPDPARIPDCDKLLNDVNDYQLLTWKLRAILTKPSLSSADQTLALATLTQAEKLLNAGDFRATEVLALRLASTLRGAESPKESIWTIVNDTATSIDTFKLLDADLRRELCRGIALAARRGDWNETEASQAIATAIRWHAQAIDLDTTSGKPLLIEERDRLDALLRVGQVLRRFDQWETTIAQAAQRPALDAWQTGLELCRDIVRLANEKHADAEMRRQRATWLSYEARVEIFESLTEQEKQELDYARLKPDDPTRRTVAYLRAKAEFGGRIPRPNWTIVAPALLAAYPSATPAEMAPLDPRAPFRTTWTSQQVQQLVQQSWDSETSNDFLKAWRSPFREGSDPGQLATLLNLLDQLPKPLPAAPLPTRLRLARPLAAWLSGNTSPETRAALLSIAAEPAAQLGTDALPVWCMAFQAARGASPVDIQPTLTLANQLLFKVMESKPAPQTGLALYERVVSPASDLLQPGVQLADPSLAIQLSLEAIDLLETFPEADWHFGSGPEKFSREELKLCERGLLVAGMDPRRSQLLAGQAAAHYGLYDATGDRELLNTAISQAESVLQLAPKDRLASGVLSKALTERGLARNELADKLQDLDRAIVFGQEAIQGQDESPRRLKRNQYYLAGALLQRANLRGDSQESKEDLLQGAQTANRAMMTRVNNQLDQLVLGVAGNTEEDLGWLIGSSRPSITTPEERRGHYANALLYFTEAIDPVRFPAPPAEAYMNRARCLVKMVGTHPYMLGSNFSPQSVSDLIPADRGIVFASRDEALNEARDNLLRAIEIATIRAADAQILAQSHRWLGWVQRESNRLDEASSSFQTALTKIMDRENYRAVPYFRDWVSCEFARLDFPAAKQSVQQMLTGPVKQSKFSDLQKRQIETTALLEQGQTCLKAVRANTLTEPQFLLELTELFNARPTDRTTTEDLGLLKLRLTMCGDVRAPDNNLVTLTEKESRQLIQLVGPSQDRDALLNNWTAHFFLGIVHYRAALPLVRNNAAVANQLINQAIPSFLGAYQQTPNEMTGVIAAELLGSLAQSPAVPAPVKMQVKAVLQTVATQMTAGQVRDYDANNPDHVQKLKNIETIRDRL